MNEEKFNLELRKFLKKVGITSQREIERAVRDGMDGGQLKGNEKLSVQARLEIPALGISEMIHGEIALE